MIKIVQHHHFRFAQKPKRDKHSQREDPKRRSSRESIPGERKFRTLQDRLVNELKRENITTYEEANRYLEEVYIPKHNARFSVVPKSNDTAFLPTKINLKRIFSRRYERMVGKDNTVSLDTKFTNCRNPSKQNEAGRRVGADCTGCWFFILNLFCVLRSGDVIDRHRNDWLRRLRNLKRKERVLGRQRVVVL